jgi:hypothetical protein
LKGKNMSLEIFQARDDWGQVQRVVQFTTASGKITYTAKTGRATDDFVIDRVIRVTSTADYALTITLPDGVYYDQRCLVIFEVLGDDETVDVTTDTGDNGTQLSAAGGHNEFVWAGSTIGWLLVNSSAT